MSDLTDFLLARIAEKRLSRLDCFRWRIALWVGTTEFRRQKALPYADHPDYREEWKP